MPDSNSSHNPLGSLPINTLLPKFAIPSIVAYLVTSLYNIVDQIFIGQGVGYLGNAATNVAFPFTTVSTAIALMMGIGTAANFNLNLGAGHEERARRVAGTGLSCLALFSLTLGLIALFFRGPLLNLFGATPEVLPYAMIYTGITAFGLPMVTFTTGASSLVRADGSPTYSMLCTLSGAVLNTILDPVFIFGLDMGVAGGALATVLGQALSLVMVLYYLFRTRIRTIRLTAASLHPSGPLLRAICSLGVSPFLNQMAMFLVQITLNNTLTYYGALSHYGEDIPLACVGVISKVNILMLGFTLGISQGCQPIFSYNYGARNPGRVRRAFQVLLMACLAYSLLLWALVQLFPQLFALMFTSDSELVSYASWALRIYMAATGIFGIQIACQQTFVALGNAKISLFLAVLRKIILLIPFIYILPNFFADKAFAVFLAEPVADFLAVCTTATMFAVHFKKSMTALEGKPGV